MIRIKVNGSLIRYITESPYTPNSRRSNKRLSQTPITIPPKSYSHPTKVNTTQSSYYTENKHYGRPSALPKHLIEYDQCPHYYNVFRQGQCNPPHIMHKLRGCPWITLTPLDVPQSYPPSPLLLMFYVPVGTGY